MNEPLIFPVGHLLGTASADGSGHQLVRIGWELYPLEAPEQLAMWALAHGLPEGADMAPWTRTAAAGAARVAGIRDAGRVLDELMARDLVVEVEPSSAAAAEFAKVCRPRSLLVGVGNTADEPAQYGIGPNVASVSVRVDPLTFELWKWGHACDSLWHACEILAAAGRDAGVDEPDVLARCLAGLQVLIAHGAAYLDEAREEWDQHAAGERLESLAT